MDEEARALTTLTAEFRSLGVRSGQDLLAHSSLRAVGHVAGGAATVLRALRDAMGTTATLVVPAQTTLNSLSSDAFHAATATMTQAQRADFIAAMPGFDPLSTPSRGMGVLAELVRTSPGAARSAHPQSSFAAVGSRAAQSMARHDLTCHLGEDSPLGWLYRADAAILLLGVGYDMCTAFHLAEYRLPGQPRQRDYRCVTAIGGVRHEHCFVDIELDDGDFSVLGDHIDDEPFVRHGRVGSAECRLMPIRAAVDVAASWPPFRQRRRRADQLRGRRHER
ncbi:MAG TPA: AAC(3) family N-acetyltransferase [Streptosporangiaceae bacterium]|jgi:aminoglycoside 3-N-acetyltransferase|nr:AAC(3) family N-acetyltransferase [Streptosporangiaceae bacterium]